MIYILLWNTSLPIIFQADVIPCSFISSRCSTRALLMFKVCKKSVFSKVTLVKDFCLLIFFPLIALLETKAQQQFSSSIPHALAPRFNWEFNYDYHLGRILSLWPVSILSSSTQMITCFVPRVNSAENYFVSFVYGLNTYTERTKKRLLVRNFSCSCFNNSRLYTHPLNPSCHFNFILILGNLREADLIGTLRFQNSEIVFLHWWNSSTDDSIIYRKLDMILVNDTWLNCFPIYMENFPLSDNSPATIHLAITWIRLKRPLLFLLLFVRASCNFI